MSVQTQEAMNHHGTAHGSKIRWQCCFQAAWCSINVHSLQELAEKLAEPLQRTISAKFFTGAVVQQAAAAAQGSSAAAIAPAELAKQLAEARQAASASVKVNIDLVCPVELQLN